MPEAPEEQHAAKKLASTASEAKCCHPCVDIRGQSSTRGSYPGRTPRAKSPLNHETTRLQNCNLTKKTLFSSRRLVLILSMFMQEVAVIKTTDVQCMFVFSRFSVHEMWVRSMYMKNSTTTKRIFHDVEYRELQVFLL